MDGWGRLVCSVCVFDASAKSQDANAVILREILLRCLSLVSITKCCSYFCLRMKKSDVMHVIIKCRVHRGKRDQISCDLNNMRRAVYTVDTLDKAISWENIGVIYSLV